MTTHIPVLTAEALLYLQPERGGLFVDCTVGLGGHARALLEAGATRILGFDRDPAAIAAARHNLAAWADRVELVHADYRSLDEVLDSRRIDQIDGALADLGISSMQLEAEGRGFSFQRDEPLDMRMDPTSGETRGRSRGPVRRSATSRTPFSSTAKSASRGGSLARSSKRVTTRRSPRPGSSPRSSGGRSRAGATCGSIPRPVRSRRSASG